MLLGLAGIASALLLMFLGLPVGYALAVVGIGGFAATVGLSPALAVFGQVTFDTVSNGSLVVLPLFLLMGNLVGASGMAADLYRAANAFMGHMRGGLAMATVAACGAFAAICGSSIATSATMARIALPEMERFRYAPSLAAATVACGGTLGILIPPSVALILYGVLTSTNIGDLFIAGILPGLLGMALYVAAIRWAIWRTPEAGPRGGAPMPMRERFRSLGRVGHVLALFIFIVAGIYAGAFTATEAAGMGAAGALAIALWRGGLGLGRFAGIVIETARTTAMLFFVLIGAIMFSNFLEVSGFTAALGGWLGGLDVPPWAVILGMLAIYVVLGCFLESLSMTFLTVPIFFPIVVALGYDPVWFGIFVVIVTEIALVTPPIGMNVFVIRAMAPTLRAGAFYKALVPFIAVDVLRLLAIVFVPAIVLLLPRLAG
jgi:tripartite ATP-independent transporter DctM subunit